MNKRQFISAMLAATAGLAARSAVALRRATHGIDAVVYDGRYADAGEFARALAEHGATPFAVDREPVSLWYGWLRPHLGATRGRLAGVTPHSDLALLTECAAELDLALLYEGAHDCRGASTVSHSLRARGGLAGAAAAEVFAANRRWPAALAGVLQGAALAGPWAPPQLRVDAAPRAPDHPGTLLSWVIGPV